MISASIIIPAYNEAKHLPNLLRSLENVLNFPAEIVVVDNGSEDKTAAIASQHGCKLVHVPQPSFPSVARNLGARFSRGDVFVFLDADIIVTEGWCRELRRLLIEEKLAQSRVITGDSYLISTTSSWLERHWFAPLRDKPKTYINGGNIVVPRAVFEEIDGFNPDLETGEDVDLCHRARATDIDVIFNSRLAVHHEGFPKDLRGFFKREKWHGRGDFASVHYFLKSRVAQLSILLASCYGAVVVLGLLYLYPGREVSALYVVAPILLFCLLCLFVSVTKFWRHGLRYILPGSFIYFVYFNARLASLFNSGRRGELAPRPGCNT